MVFLIELCLCAPCSTAQLDRFLNHIKYVKADIRSSLTQLNLSSLLKIKILPGEISVSYFNSQLSIRCVEFLYNRKDKSIYQKKSKKNNERLKIHLIHFFERIRNGQRIKTLYSIFDCITIIIKQII